jgi:NAD(P)-dependent dehydrogenase (short-subunit alcohol dehydrogenase family)
MLNKTCVITGCNSGIGLVASLELARQGYELFMLMRNSRKSEEAFQQVLSAADGVKVHYIPVDLSSMKATAAAADQVLAKAQKIDLLINNAGLLAREEQRTSEGLELTLAVNYFAPYLLTTQFSPLLKAADKARVVNVSSGMSKRGKVVFEHAFDERPFSGLKAYSNSKLLINYFTFKLSNFCEGSPIIANCVHPGAVNTGVFRQYPSWIVKLIGRFLLTPKQGANHLLLPAVNPAFNNHKGVIEKKISGLYFNKSKGLELSKILKHPERAEEIWEMTSKILDELLVVKA